MTWTTSALVDTLVDTPLTVHSRPAIIAMNLPIERDQFYKPYRRLWCVALYNGREFLSIPYVGGFDLLCHVPVKNTEELANGHRLRG
jgi:hypothetical protein